MATTGILSNIAGGMQYRVSGLVAGQTLRFTITDAHTTPIVANPAPPDAHSTATATGSGSYQVTYLIPADITEKDFLIPSGGNLNLVNGTNYHIVASMDYVLIAPQNLQYLSPPADGHYVATVGHGDEKFTLSAGPGLPAPNNTDAYQVTSYLVTIYPVTAPGVAIVSGGVWQQSYPATHGILDYGVDETSLVIDCLGEGISSSFPAMPLTNNTAYELIVAARNATGTVATAQTFHVSPRETPNAVTVAVAAASGAFLVDGNSVPLVDATGTTDNKVEFSITLGGTAGPANNEYDFAVIVKLTGGDNGTLYKRINLDNYDTTSTNDNSTLNGKISATGGLNPDALQNYLVANGHDGWYTNADGVTGDNTVISILDGKEYTFSAKAINVMTTTDDAAGSDDSNDASVTPSGKPIEPTFEDISTLVGHQTNTIRIKLAGPELNGGVGGLVSSGAENTDVNFNGHNGSLLTKHTLVVTTGGVPGASQEIGLVATSSTGTDGWVWDSELGYSWFDVKISETGVPLVNGTEYSLALTAHNLNGTTAADPIVVTPRYVPAAAPVTRAQPHQANMSALGSGELRGEVAAFASLLETGGTAVADISYQFQVVLNSESFETASVIHDLSGVGVTTQTFTGLVNGTKYKMRARAVTSVWENSIDGDGSGGAEGSSYDTSAKAVGGPWTTYGTTLTPSVPPSISSDTLDTIVDTIVTKSYGALNVTLGAVTSLVGGIATGTNLTTDTGAASNEDYAITGIYVTATASAGGNVGTIYIPTGSYTTSQSTNIVTPIPTSEFLGVLDNHSYTLKFQAVNNVYSDLNGEYSNTAGNEPVATDPSITVPSIESTTMAHVTNTVLPVLNIESTENIGLEQITYTWSVPDWQLDTNAQYPMGTRFVWTRTECAPTLNANGATDGRISYPEAEGVDVYSASATGTIDMIAGTTDYTSIQSGLKNGTKYKFNVSATTEAYHTNAEPIDYTDGDANALVQTPYSKATISIENGVISISSNGRVLDETIRIQSINSNFAIVDITTAMTASTASGDAYYNGGNPPFTAYVSNVVDGSNVYSLLISSVGASEPAGAHYLILTENLAGATIIASSVDVISNFANPSDQTN